MPVRRVVENAERTAAEGGGFALCAVVSDDGGEARQGAGDFERRHIFTPILDGQGATQEDRGLAVTAFEFEEAGELLERRDEFEVPRAEGLLVEGERALVERDGFVPRAAGGDGGGEVMHPRSEPGGRAVRELLVDLERAAVKRRGFRRTMQDFEQAAERVRSDGGARVHAAADAFLRLDRMAKHGLGFAELAAGAQAAGEAEERGDKFRRARAGLLFENGDRAAVKIGGFVEATAVLQNRGEQAQLRDKIGMIGLARALSDPERAPLKMLGGAHASAVAQPARDAAGEAAGAEFERVPIELGEQDAAVRDEPRADDGAARRAFGAVERGFEEHTGGVECGGGFLGREAVVHDLADEAMDEHGLTVVGEGDEAELFELAEGGACPGCVGPGGEDDVGDSRGLRREADEHVQEAARHRVEPGDAAAHDFREHRQPPPQARRGVGRGRFLLRVDRSEELLRRLARIGDGAGGELECEGLMAEHGGELFEWADLGGGGIASVETRSEQGDGGVVGNRADGDVLGAGEVARLARGDDDGAALEPRKHRLEGEPGDFVIDAVEDDEKAVGVFIRAQPAAQHLETDAVAGDFVFHERERVGVREGDEFALEFRTADGGNPEYEVVATRFEEPPRGFDGERGLARAGGAGGELRRWLDDDGAAAGESLAQVREPALATEELPTQRRKREAHVAAPHHDTWAERADERGKFVETGEGPVLAVALDRAAVIGLEHAGFVVVGIALPDRRAGARDEAENLTLQRLRDVVFIMGEGSARGAMSAVRRLGAEGESGEVDDHVALADGDFEHAVERTVIGGQVGVLDRLGADLAQGRFDDVAVRIELLRRGRGEHSGAEHHARRLRGSADVCPTSAGCACKIAGLRANGSLMSSANRSLGLAALGWWLASRGLAEPIDESFSRLDPAGVQRLGRASRVAALATVRGLARALRDAPANAVAQSDLFTPGTAWLDRLDTLLNAPRVGLRIEKALTGDAGDFDVLLEGEMTENRSVMLAARLAEWLHSQVGGTDSPTALAAFLAQGWPPEPGADQRVTFVQEFLANLRTELADTPAEVTMPLGDPSEFLEWLDGEVGRLAAAAPREAMPLDLPPPTPPTTPAPPIELPEADEHAVTDEEADEYKVAELARAAPLVPEIVHEQAELEHRRLRWWAIVIQIVWIALLFLGWRLLQQHRRATPAPAARSASPKPTSKPAFKAATPATPQPAMQPTSSAAVATPAPLPVEMSVGQEELESQALALAAAGHHAEAAAFFRRLVQVQAQDRNMGRLPRALIHVRMAASLAALERWDEADASIERAQALVEELLPTRDPETALGIEMVADYWASRERWPLAARLYQKAVQTYEGTKSENSLGQLSAINRLAGALRQVGDLKGAEQLYRQLAKAFAGGGSAVATDAASAAHNLANLLLVTNRAGEARGYYEEAFAWLTKAPASDEHAKRMGTLMQANYERCLGAIGLPPEEIRERVRKAMAAKAK